MLHDVKLMCVCVWQQKTEIMTANFTAKILAVYGIICRQYYKPCHRDDVIIYHSTKFSRPTFGICRVVQDWGTLSPLAMRAVEAKLFLLTSDRLATQSSSGSLSYLFEQ